MAILLRDKAGLTLEGINELGDGSEPAMTFTLALS